MNPKTVIRKLGGLKVAAVKLSYTENALRYWLRTNKIPKHAQKWIAIVLAGKV